MTLTSRPEVRYPGVMSFEIDDRPAPKQAAVEGPLGLHGPPAAPLGELAPSGSERLKSLAIRVGLLLGLALLFSRCYLAVSDRPAFLPLAYDRDGVATKEAGQLVFFLHGYGGSASDVAWVAEDLRKRKLAESTTIVTIDGAYALGTARCWGDEPAEYEDSIERVSAFIRKHAAGRPREQGRLELFDGLW